jgi:ribonuclease P protein component
MPKKYRLSGEEIRKLSGKRMHGTFFSFLVAPIAGSSAKCACVVSKKVSAKAVDRNKVKRRCRSVLAKRMPNLKKPLALVLYAKREAKDAEFSKIERDIDVLFSKL